MRVALQERKKRLELEHPKGERRPLREFMEEMWARTPPELLGKPISKEEREDILGIGPGGV